MKRVLIVIVAEPRCGPAARARINLALLNAPSLSLHTFVVLRDHWTVKTEAASGAPVHCIQCVVLNLHVAALSTRLYRGIYDIQRTSICGVVVSTLASQPSDHWFESCRPLVHRPVLTGKVGRSNLPAKAKVR